MRKEVISNKETHENPVINGPLKRDVRMYKFGFCWHIVCMQWPSDISCILSGETFLLVQILTGNLLAIFVFVCLANVLRILSSIGNNS